MQYVGIDSKMFSRIAVKRDGSKGKFESVLGAAIRSDDFYGFDKSYSKALGYALKQIGVEQDYKYYCSHDIWSFEKKDVFLDSFFKKMYPAIEKAHVFYTLFSQKQLSNIQVYGRMSRRLNIKLAKPTRTREELISQHINQCFPAICAWRLTPFFNPRSTQFHFDSYQGHICEAQEEIEKFKRIIYPNGDCSNPLISTADLLLSLLDIRLEKAQKFLLFENIRPMIPELGEKIIAYPILNQHLPRITPLDTIPINNSSLIKHPVFWVFKNDPMITNEFLKGTKAYRNLIDYAAGKGGVVKSFNKTEDVIHIIEGDYGVYFDGPGKETVNSYNKLGKPLIPYSLDLMIPSKQKDHKA